ADGADADALIDLNAIDFDALAARFAGKKRSSVQRLTKDLSDRVEASARRNPARLGLVERLRKLIEDYNAGSLNVDEMLRRLQSLSQQLSADEQRTVSEGLSEPEMAVFDLLTQPDPTLTTDQRDEVKRVARKLMAHIEERLVLDWRKKAQTRESARVLVKDVLDELPDAYDRPTWERKSEIVFNHLFASYYDDGGSVYAEAAGAVTVMPVTEPSTVVNVATVTAGVLAQITSDTQFAELVAEQLRGSNASFAVPTPELVAGDETHQVEFKSTARWNIREERKDKRMEDAIVKTVAGLLNTEGGTLLIGVDDAGRVLGLDSDLSLVKPPSPDGFVNWLTTHLITALNHTPTMRTKARIDRIDDTDLCRVDVARSSSPVYARMSDKAGVFWVRINNSTRALPELEIEDYVREHWR
ncbi:MAG: DUF3387 domain-containing protein, partial [Solirubrobacterales bacterium]|nr:DUF3387 domain-containing protein [Solirubrobacterales bacterium]